MKILSVSYEASLLGVNGKLVLDSGFNKIYFITSRAPPRRRGSIVLPLYEILLSVMLGSVLSAAKAVPGSDETAMQRLGAS